MKIHALSANRKAGLEIGFVFPHLRHLSLPKLEKIETIDMSSVDLVFLCSPAFDVTSGYSYAA